jgi:hypothetical protein
VRHLRDEVLATYLVDTDKARCLEADGSYRRRQPAPGENAFGSQAAFVSRAGR